MPQKITEASYASCVADSNDYKEKCLAQMGAGSEAEYTIECSEQVYAEILCACLYNASCGTLSTAELYIKIAKAIETEYANINSKIKTTDYLKNFELPLDGELLWIKDYHIPKGDGNQAEKHTGVDFGALIGSPVYAMNDGIVVFAGVNGKNGNMVIIDHGNGYTTSYSHLDLKGINVKEGDLVLSGSEIGKLGNTGGSSGPHLHLEVRFNDFVQDPKNFLYGSSKEKLELNLNEKASDDISTSQTRSNFSDDQLLAIGNNVVKLNYTLPMEYENLPENKKQEVTLKAMVQFSSTNGFNDSDTANKGPKALAYAMDNIFAINPSDAYALYQLGQEQGTEFRQADIFKEFQDKYIPDDYSNPISSAEKNEIDREANPLSLGSIDEFVPIYAYPENVQYNNQTKIDMLREQYAEIGTLYKLDDSDVDKYMNVVNSKITIYNEGADKVMVFDDGKNEPFAFAVTTDPAYRYSGLDGTKGVATISDKIEIGHEVYYPMTERGYVGINQIQNIHAYHNLPGTGWKKP